MDTTSSSSLLETLRLQRFLDATQLQQLTGTAFADAKSLAKELIQRGWLTPYQANQLLNGKGQQLVLGSYLLLERLGEGGMGQVFKARHRTLHRICALKLIRKERLDNPNAVKRFQREVRSAAALSHPHIVHAYDADVIDGTYLMVMEYIEGAVDLSKLVKKNGPLPVERACDYIRQAALGLQHAFERGLVHRDIKPANLLLTQDGKLVKVLDMGLARLDQAVEDGDSTSTMTQEGAVLGTPDYIAPEQALDTHTVDIRADLYSLGCAFYFLLTGRVPFPGGTLLQKLNKHQNEEPLAIAKLRPTVPPAVTDVVRKLMAKRPDERYQTPAELAVELAELGPALTGMAATSDVTIADKEPPPASEEALRSAFAYIQKRSDTVAVPSPDGRRTRPKVPRWLLVTLATSFTVVVCLAVILFCIPGGGKNRTDEEGESRDVNRKGPPKIEEAKANEDPKTGKDFDPALPWRPKELVKVVGAQRFDSWRRGVSKVHLSKDGKTLYASSQDGTITIRDADSGRVRQLFEHRVWWNYASATFAVSPDERWLVYQQTDKDLVVWDLKENKRVKTLPELAIDLKFSPDGKLLAMKPPKLKIIEPATDWKVKKEMGIEYEGWNAFAAVSRDSKRAAVIFESPRGSRVRTFDIGSGDPVSDFPIERRITFGTFGVSHDDFFFGGYTAPKHLIGRIDLKTGKIEPEREIYNPQGVALSPDRKQLLVSRFGDFVAVKPHDLSQIWLQSLSGFGEVRGIAHSGDGERVALADSNGFLEIRDAKTGEPISKPLPHHMAYSQFFALPDGRAFLSGANIDSRLFDFVTGKDISIPKINEMNATYPTPDGKQLIIARPKENHLAIVDLEGKRVRDVKVGLGVHAAVPIDGGRKLLLRTRDTLKIVDFQSGVVEKKFPSPRGEMRGLAVDAAGRRAALAHSIDGRLDVYDLPTAKLERSIELKGPVWRAHLVFSRDGQWLACGHADSSYGAGPHGGKVRLWAAATGAERLLVVPKDCRPGYAIAISPNGEELANGGLDGSVHFWDIQTGNYRRSIRVGPANGVILHVAYTPDGRHLVVNTPCGMVLLLRLAQVPLALGKPGPWQPLLDPKLTKWGKTAKEPASVVAKVSDDETVAQLLHGGFLWPRFVVPDHHLRLEFQFPGKQHAELRGHFSTPTGSSGLLFLIRNNGKVVRDLWSGASASDAMLQNGDIVPRGARQGGGAELGNVDLGPPGTWNRLDIVRVGDRLAFFLNGRFLSAVANLRWLEKDKEIEPTKGSFGWSSAGEVLLRHIAVRDITAFQPELIEPGR